MLRKILIVSVCAAVSAAVPATLEKNPEAILRWMHGGTGGETANTAPAAKTPGLRVSSLSGRSARIPADASGHFRAEFKINGRRVDGMIDTGATVVALNESTVRRLGVKLAPADFRHEVQTANGSTRAAAATLKSVSLGRIHLEDVEAVVLEDRALSGTLVGMSFLRRLDGFRVEDGALLLKQ
ncbi:MAG TPA: TIGR02281 family clan AA aspartic protease [Mesorhizobium sp.]|jgi:aspartyl protease family protein|nr:TIGR02281 family clan AA aspartic protease [Mesorhizobium sp.]